MKTKNPLDKKINSLEQLLIKLKAQREEERLNYLVEKKVEEILKLKIEEFNPTAKTAFTIKEAEKMYSTSRSTLERAIRENKLPVIQKQSFGNRLIKKTDLDNLFFNTNKK
ncbi:helix-turn-helix domain-containing protein [Flavobacterium sediminis]|nr:helix-turn-helix domain-containing protein [Flavobacterium sediminis]